MLKKICMFAICLFMTAASAVAVEVGGLTIAETFDSGQGELIRNGSGIRKKFGFKIYVGSLYLKAKTSD